MIKGFSKDGNDYRCMDPREEEETVLSDYGSRVYDWYTVGKMREEVDLDKKEIEKESEEEIWYWGSLGIQNDGMITAMGIFLYYIPFKAKFY